ncbi:hypothetical protein Cgig2_031058 [Carnegiea gigantea]|uniref:Uncharacterized protein n=1 Tax=Carnegiea gigantea TaxID=171969 RepID=A0A9Q1QGH0_9CARY|nr:hypothetical protein Cgig2_031058 [Carnegiea gigantea]
MTEDVRAGTGLEVVVAEVEQTQRGERESRDLARRSSGLCVTERVGSSRRGINLNLVCIELRAIREDSLSGRLVEARVVQELVDKGGHRAGTRLAVVIVAKEEHKRTVTKTQSRVEKGEEASPFALLSLNPSSQVVGAFMAALALRSEQLCKASLADKSSAGSFKSPSMVADMDVALDISNRNEMGPSCTRVAAELPGSDPNAPKQNSSLTFGSSCEIFRQVSGSRLSALIAICMEKMMIKMRKNTTEEAFFIFTF